MKAFTKLLKNKKFPKDKCSWHVEGVLHTKTNKSYKFDLTPIKKFKDGSEGKIGFFNTQAEKMVFNYLNKWIIIDIEELHSYIKNKNIKNLLIKDLLEDLTWNIIIDK